MEIHNNISERYASHREDQSFSKQHHKERGKNHNNVFISPMYITAKDKAEHVEEYVHTSLLVPGGHNVPTLNCS